MVMPFKSYIKTIAEPESEVPEINQTNPNKENTMDANVMFTKEQFDEIKASFAADAKKATAEGIETALKSLPAINKGEVSVIKDEADKPFEKMGMYLGAVKQATLTQGRECHPRLKALNMKALGANELIGSEGGFLLEPSFAAGLLTPVHEAGPFSSRCAQLEIGPNANGITVRAVDETSRADCYRWGGILGYRLAEAGTKLPVFPTFRLVELRLKKYAVLCYATDELLQDTTALAGIIQQGCSEELDFMVNDDILNGLGAAGPLGILASGALVSVGKEAGQLAATVVTQNVFKMWARLHPRSKGNAVWFINTDVTPQLYQLSLSVGTGGMPMYMAPGSLPNAPSGALLGRPVVETEFNATLGTQGDIVLADMSQYAMIDRDVQAASSIHVQFLTDQVAYRFVYRCDGQPKIAKPLTPYKGSGTLSPFVTLDARS
jgi:HK97 family phage major capsid protein